MSTITEVNQLKDFLRSLEGFSNLKVDHYLGTALFDGHNGKTLNIPSSRPLPRSVQALPFVVVGFDAFRSCNNFLKAYPLSNLSSQQHVFKYRLARA